MTTVDEKLQEPTPRFSSIKDFAHALGVDGNGLIEIPPTEVYMSVPDRSGVYFHRIHPVTYEVELLYHLNHSGKLSVLVELLGVRWAAD